jgi:hypothetical protein
MLDCKSRITQGSKIKKLKTDILKSKSTKTEGDLFEIYQEKKRKIIIIFLA